VREAQAKQAEAAKVPEAEAAPSGDGKKPAEKRPTGRSAGDAAVESAESATAA